MFTKLLLIVIIISCTSFIKGFTKLNPRLIPFSKTKLNARITSTTFYEDENGNDKRRKKTNRNYNYYSDRPSDSDFNFNNLIRPNNRNVDNEELLYTLIWFDCEDCRKLLNDVKNTGKKILYIDGTYYFFDENDETNTPIFYKNDELIATDIFSIYEELFYNKIKTS